MYQEAELYAQYGSKDPDDLELMEKKLEPIFFASDRFA